jgi:hypothetical protein
MGWMTRCRGSCQHGCFIAFIASLFESLFESRSRIVRIDPRDFRRSQLTLTYIKWRAGVREL